MMSGCKEAGLDSNVWVLSVSVAASRGVVTSTRQANMLVLAGSSCTAALVELCDLPSMTKGRLG